MWLKTIIRQRGCLAVLACLQDGKPRAVSQLSADTGQSEATVRAHLTQLARLSLIEPADG
jgi:DNA-binding IclR family transcriptional regulator